MKTKKVLIVTTISGFVQQFEMNNVKILQELGYEVHYAANYNTPVCTDNNFLLDGTNIIRHQVDFARSPFKKQNIKAYKQLKLIMKNEKFEFIHCHTPMGGVIARLCARVTNIPFVIYTAHGFHFYKGAPIFNWLFFYPVEKFLAKWTNIIITINKEDFKRASKFKLKENGRVEYVCGIGIDLNKFKSKMESRYEIRKQLNIEENDFVLVSVGELSKRKNHEVIINALVKVKKKIPNIKYIICGKGDLKNYLTQRVIDLKLDDNVIFTGYKENVVDILNASDCFVFPSKQEGLPVSLMEAMAVGLPVICSYIRGNRDLIKYKKGGFFIKNDNIQDYASKILIIANNKNIKDNMGNWNRQRVKSFSKDKVELKMRNIYKMVSQEVLK